MGRTPFRGAVPDRLRYDPDHDMWVRRDGAEVVFGASAFGARALDPEWATLVS